MPLAALACAPVLAERDAGGPRSSHGIAVGEVGATRAVVWGRARRADRKTGAKSADAGLRMEVRLETATGGDTGLGGDAPVELEHDRTARVVLEGLTPDTVYRAVVRFVGPDGRPGPPDAATFRTAPPPDAPAPVRLAWGGDVAGQGVCRDAALGLPIVRAVRAAQPDLFVGLGDMIYADDLCEPIGRYGNAQVPGSYGVATELEGFRAHWRYVRKDPDLAALLASTPYVAVLDDHEVLNDVGPHHDTRDEPPYRAGVPLLPLGVRAFREWNPLAPDQPLYRRLRWGRHLELFVLDTREFRDPNFAPDDGALPKSMLGVAQRRWLESAVAASDATWKVIASSVPLSIPTGSPERGRDGWADLGTDTGFERELLEILASFRDAGVRNLVWITTDVHFAAAFRYVPFPDAPGFRFVEIATGPMNAGLYPREELDRTLRPERLFFHGPADPDAIQDFASALPWFSFGVLEVDGAGDLVARVVNGAGETIFRLALAPVR